MNIKNKMAKAIVLALSTLSLSTAVSATQIANNHSPKDPGVINQERIVYWLKKRGELKQDASQKAINEALVKYIGKASITVMDGKYQQPVKLKNNNLMKNGVAKTVKALGILVDFPDLPYNNNRLTSSDTSMYYSDYNVDHYRQLMFSTTGFTGPSNQNLMSGYQYYQQESGNEFFFTGDVFGWVTANSNSEVYGGPDPDDEGVSDIDPSTLIQEAVTKAVAEFNIDLADYDLEDPFDLDGDGNLNESDGFIDHVNIFHSSVGEEAGGGVLGDSAIWSHRFFVNQTGVISTMGFVVPGSTKKLFGYTIQPIDAGAGVVVHEFGHDLGLPDEYDIDNSAIGAPTGIWSVMAGGSWAGSPAGSKPVGFSPYAKEFLQTRHGTNWLSQTVVDLSDLSGSPQTINLVEAVNHTAINQVKVAVPAPLITLGAPYSGEHQYYSGRGDNLRVEMNFDLNIPVGTSISLSMKGRWNTELDWDYVQMSINGGAVKGNHTIDTNPKGGQFPIYADVVNYISGKSSSITGAEGELGWVDLTYDLSAYQGQSVAVKFYYYTDTNTGDYGFVFDDLSLVTDGATSFTDGAETADVVTLSGFSRITDSVPGKPQNYYVQLRSHNQVDAGLAARNYEPGVVVWLRDENYSDNKVTDHAGHGFIGVVDADQNMIGSRTSSIQIRDAAFSQYNQSAYGGDNHLAPTSTFLDTNDYSSPTQKESGLVLPVHGLVMEVMAQSANSSTATIQLSVVPVGVSANFDSSVNERSVSFTNTSNGQNLTYSWSFGDGSGVNTDVTPSHVYAADGNFTVTLTVTDENSETASFSQSVVISTQPHANFINSVSGKAVTFTNASSGGVGGLTYLWDFGDSTNSTEQSPSHTYSADGTYSVVLTVTDSESRTNVFTKSIVISTAVAPPPTETSSDSGGGGPLGWFSIMSLSLLIMRRKIRK